LLHPLLPRPYPVKGVGVGRLVVGSGLRLMRAGVAGVKQYNFSCFETELLNRFNARHLQCLFSFCSRMQKVLHIRMGTSTSIVHIRSTLGRMCLRLALVDSLAIYMPDFLSAGGLKVT